MGPFDLTSEKISFTFQRLIQKDALGDFYDGVGNPVYINTTKYFYQNTPPPAPVVHDRWSHSDTGVEYVYIDDGISKQWVQPY